MPIDRMVANECKPIAINITHHAICMATNKTYIEMYIFIKFPPKCVINRILRTLNILRLFYNIAIEKLKVFGMT